jgi:RNA-binding protein
MALAKSDIRALKAKAHHLNPVVTIGQKGLTDNVTSEVDIALNAHELIKVKAYQHAKDECLAYASALGDSLSAEFIALIGHTLILYRKNPEKN